MIYFDFSFMFITFSIMTYFALKRLILETIDKIGTISKYYPRKYIIPKTWIRKIFSIKKNLIPRFIYIELYIALFLILLGPINIIISLFFIAFKNFQELLGTLILFQSIFNIFNIIYFVIMSILYKKH